MVNYIFADYKRVISRFPRIVFLIIFEAVFAFSVLQEWSKTAGNYNSIALLNSSDLFFSLWFTDILCLITFVQSFSYDFSAKTIQVALGIGITRLQVIISKLIQIVLVMLTDMLVTLGVLGVLCAVTGTSFAGHQILYVLYNAMGAVILASLTVCLTMPLVFRTQNMVISLLGCFMLIIDVPAMLLRLISRIGPVFLARLELDRFTHASCVNITVTNAVTGNFQLWSVIGVIVWFVLGIYVTWLFFRKQELDF